MGDIMAVSHNRWSSSRPTAGTRWSRGSWRRGRRLHRQALLATELVARVRAALRRYAAFERSGAEGHFVLGDLAIDYDRRQVTLSGDPVEVTAREFDLLVELATQAGRVVPRDRLLRRVWSPGKPGNLRVLRTHLMQPAAQAGGGRRESQVHLRRAAGGLLDARRGDGKQQG